MVGNRRFKDAKCNYFSRQQSLWLRLAAPALLAALTAGPSTCFAQSPVGALTGVIRNAANVPLAGATVTAEQQDGPTIRGTVSNSEGIYSFSDLIAGTYSVISETQGYPNVTVPAAQVVARRVTRVDIAMTAAGIPSSVPTTISSARQPESEKQDLVASLTAPPLGRIVSPFPGINLTRDTPVVHGPAFPNPAASTAPTASSSAPNSVPSQAAAGPTPQSAAAAPPSVDMLTPFADYDWTWQNGNSRQKDTPLDTKYFSPEFRADTFFGLDFNQPKDHSMGGSSEVFRNGEVQVEDLSIGGDFHVDNVRGRVLALFGMFAATTVRNDASPAVGQWDVRSAYKYVSEAYGGYHFNVNHGLNIDAGIFVSYVGLFSYHNFDNWAYQPSYVSSNTPWFFNGVRVQWFPTHHLKIEPWLINGWQAYKQNSMVTLESEDSLNGPRNLG